MVNTTWMPATSPTWLASSWAALITPYSDSASSLDMVADVAGMDTPIPRPERASAIRMTTSPDDTVSVAKRIMEKSSAAVPKRVALRSPVRMVMYPAMGALMAKTSGRATERNPTWETLYP